MEDGTLSIDHVQSTITETVLGLWTDFLGHLPFLVAAVFIVALTALVVALFRRFSSRLIRKWRLRRSLKALLTRLASIGIWLVGILIASMIVFPGLTPAKALGGLGLVSVAVGFAFKDIFENFFAGVLILWRFPFENGDFIECGGIMGRVEEVTIRMTQIRRPTGELVVVPNSFLFKNPVDVLTHEPERRVTVMVGVAYDEDVSGCVDVIRAAVEGCSTVASSNEVEIYPQAFGSSSIDIETTWWTGNTPRDVRRSRAEVVTAVKAALDDAGIEIPFPYRTLTFKEALPVVGATNANRNRVEPDPADADNGVGVA